MKKTYTLFIMLIALLIVLFTSTAGIVFAEELDYDESDKLLLQTIRELFKTDSEINYLNANKEVIYDINLKPLGYVYDFSVNQEQGYAIVSNTESEGLKVSELYFGAENPYRATNGLNTYITQFIYADFFDGIYTILESGVQFNKEELIELCENAFMAGNNGISFDTSEIFYSYRTVNTFNLANRFPSYTAFDLTNACSPIAGGNIIAYYDRFCVNLIPNYTPGSSIGSSYLYKNTSTTTLNVIAQLYDDMGTNAIIPGTTQGQFFDGLQTFSMRQGYNISFANCMSGNNLNYTYTKEQIDGGKPIALFLSKYNITEIIEEINMDKLNYLIGTINHMMVGFGYKEITYHFSNGSINTDRYLNVATGNSQQHSGYFNISLNSIIDSAYSVNIY